MCKFCTGVPLLENGGQPFRIHAIAVHRNRDGLPAQGPDQGQGTDVAGALHQHPVARDGHGFQNQGQPRLGPRHGANAPAVGNRLPFIREPPGDGLQVGGMTGRGPIGPGLGTQFLQGLDVPTAQGLAGKQIGRRKVGGETDQAAVLGPAQGLAQPGPKLILPDRKGGTFEREGFRIPQGRRFRQMVGHKAASSRDRLHPAGALEPSQGLEHRQPVDLIAQGQLWHRRKAHAWVPLALLDKHTQGPLQLEVQGAGCIGIEGIGGSHDRFRIANNP